MPSAAPATAIEGEPNTQVPVTSPERLILRALRGCWASNEETITVADSSTPR